MEVRRQPAVAERAKRSHGLATGRDGDCELPAIALWDTALHLTAQNRIPSHALPAAYIVVGGGRANMRDRATEASCHSGARLAGRGGRVSRHHMRRELRGVPSVRRSIRGVESPAESARPASYRTRL